MRLLDRKLSTPHIERYTDHPYRRRRRRTLATLTDYCFVLVFVLDLAQTVDTLVVRPLGGTQCSSSQKCFPSLLSRRLGFKSDNEGFKLCMDRGPAADSFANGDYEQEDAKDSRSYHRITPEKLVRLKESIDIVSVIESYQLKGFQRKGENRAIAVCPFHNDHNPSLSIDGNRRLFKCFACGVGGDVFNFVRKYSALGGEEMSFYQAVRHVAKEFGDAVVQREFGSGETGMTTEKRSKLQAKKERILLANTAAADFFGNNLVNLPAAGAARALLRARGLSPTTVRAFAMGFAPDFYFKGDKTWGKGSLVNHLRDLGFTPNEIVEAGLATRTKRAQWADVVDGGDDTNRNSEMSLDDDFSTLIDRFRGRLMVPIFDGRGQNVIGFGGRDLTLDLNDTSKFRTPKYLNSPETIVFQKKNELFGLHYAREALKEMKSHSSGPSSLGQESGSIVIVEGYMDVISLWDAGIREVVASMGTALTMEQLATAARTAGIRGGRVILCLDADAAGLDAIERVCSGSLLAKISETNVVEILVATLPPGTKDPGEFIETRTRSSRKVAGEQFRHEVLEKSIDWVDWYIQRILSCYNAQALRGTPGSFGDTCDRVSEFISTFPNPGDRTLRAHEVAELLAEAIAKDTEDGEVSSALRIQLESDLLAMVTRKAGAKESAERRIEFVDGMSSGGTAQTLEKMGRGEFLGASSEESRLSSRALNAITQKEFAIKTQRAKDSKVTEDQTYSGLRRIRRTSTRRNERRRLVRNKRAKPVQPPLIPHFSGFEFENQSDADWLGIPREKWKRRKHLTLGASVEGGKWRRGSWGRNDDKEDVQSFGDSGPVYFNSNKYHGNHFLTPEAMDAGYSHEMTPRDPSLFERGVASLLSQDHNRLLLAAEDKLLRCLVQHGSARKALKTALATSDATGCRGNIEWSSSDREWLFTKLTEMTEQIPDEALNVASTSELRDYFARLSDAPAGAFGGSNSSVAEANSSEAEVVLSVNGTIENASQALALGTNKYSSISLDVDAIENWAASHDFDQEAFTVKGRNDVDSSVLSQDDANNEQQQLRRTSAITGTLDRFFGTKDEVVATTYSGSVPSELRAELEVQEAFAALLTASAMRRLAVVKEDYVAADLVLNQRNGKEDAPQISSSHNATGHDVLPPTDISALHMMPLDELNEYCLGLGKKLKDLSETVNQLCVTGKRTGSRLMDYGSTNGLEGRISMAMQEELAAAVDEWVENLPETLHNQSRVEPFFGDGRSHYSSTDPARGWSDDPEDLDDRLNEELARIESDWGHWCNDEFHWSPVSHKERTNWIRRDAGDLELHQWFGPNYDSDLDEDEETLEDALRRIDLEWGDWCRDEAPTVASDDLPKSPTAENTSPLDSSTVGRESTCCVSSTDPPLGWPDTTSFKILDDNSIFE